MFLASFKITWTSLSCFTTRWVIVPTCTFALGIFDVVRFIHNDGLPKSTLLRFQRKKKTETAPFERKPTTPTLTVSTNLVRTPISRKLHMPRFFIKPCSLEIAPFHVLPSHGFFARISYEVITSFASALGFLNRMKTCNDSKGNSSEHTFAMQNERLFG